MERGSVGRTAPTLKIFAALRAAVGRSGPIDSKTAKSQAVAAVDERLGARLAESILGGAKTAGFKNASMHANESNPMPGPTGWRGRPSSADRPGGLRGHVAHRSAAPRPPACRPDCMPTCENSCQGTRADLPDMRDERDHVGGAEQDDQQADQAPGWATAAVQPQDCHTPAPIDAASSRCSTAVANYAGCASLRELHCGSALVSARSGHLRLPPRAFHRRLLPPPAGADNKIMVCGPPPMYKAICGPKKFEEGKPPKQGEVGGILKELGFTEEGVFKF